MVKGFTISERASVLVAITGEKKKAIATNIEGLKEEQLGVWFGFGTKYQK